ncbi:MAG: polyprenyl synthetase family protein [Chlamydiales bacterium]
MDTVNRFKELIEAELERLIPADPSSLYEGGRYILLAPCKRIRPLLTLATAEMLHEGGWRQALYPACSLEMVHTYSLIHDDLPCMDDDKTRRGRPALHCVYNEGHAVLVGDYLLTYAFEILASAPFLSNEQKMALVTTLAKSAGGEGMVGGQVMDLENHSFVTEMNRRKTACLFQAALAFGGIASDCSPHTLQTLKTFGIQFGQLFQMVDDILDHEDTVEGENPFENANTLYYEVLQTLKKIPKDSSTLNYLTKLVFEQLH